MQKADGENSLRECSRLLKPGKLMFLSCPNTPENQDGFDVRYKAHVYEWKISEIKKELEKNNFMVESIIGLVGDSAEFKEKLERIEVSPLKSFLEKAKEYLPTNFLLSMFFIPYPEIASEVLFICKKKEEGTLI